MFRKLLLAPKNRFRNLLALKSQRRWLSIKATSAPEDNKASSKVAEQADDFLGKHGGKVAVVAMSIAVYLFYSFYESGQDRNRIEEHLSEEMSLEPYEIQEIRTTNRLPCDKFDVIVERAYQAFPNGAVSYEEFIGFVEAEGVSLRSGHLIDRVVAKYASGNTATMPIPLNFLLVTLNMAVGSDADSRVASLSIIARRASGDSDKESSIPTDAVSELVGHLMLSSQVPVEKCVVETGVKYPVRTHRPKTPDDFVNKARSSLKPPHVSSTLTDAEVKSILFSSEVCLWGECYRGAD